VVAAGVAARAVAFAAGRPSEPPATAGFYAPPLPLPASPIPIPAPAFPLPAQESECYGRPPERFYEFYFTRAIYNGGGFGGGSWATDFPKADCQFVSVIKRLAGLDTYADSWAIRLDDPKLRHYPFLYALEVGRNGGWRLTEDELQGLRSYLAAGGFLVIDDFWGTQQWAAFEREMMRILPDREIVDIPMDHELFRAFYTIEEILQVPNIGNGRAIHYGFPGAVTYQQDGYVPRVRGIFADDGRLMVLINWNTDMGDAWEWAEQPDYPLVFSTFAFQMGVNMILYSMTH
jgi:hypothetical protein